MEGIADRSAIGVRIRALLAVGVLAVATASLSSASAFGATQPTGTGKALRAALDEVITAPEAPPGLSVLIDRKGQTQFFSRGVADVATGERPTKRLHMRIASVAKAFSGAVALALVSEGKLSLDDTIGERLPGVLPLSENVTLRQALQHTAGLPDYIRDEEFIEVLQADPARYLTPLQIVEFVADTPLTQTPGSGYEYSDTDNVVVGLMAEAATGTAPASRRPSRCRSRLCTDTTSSRARRRSTPRR
jgi:D-alanyl-D-alanine carboxypeptidase